MLRGDAMSSQYAVLPQIVDAFTYNTVFNRPHKPYNWFTLQLERLDALRRAASTGIYRMRRYVTPINLTPINPLATDKEQVMIVPGSYIIGLTFCDMEQTPVNQGGTSGAGLPTDFNITIQEHDTGMEFFSNSQSGGLSDYPLAQMLTEPRPVLGSGQYDITFINRINATRTPQLVIWCAEPCVVATEGA